MRIEEIIDGLNSIAQEKQAKNAGLPDGWPLDTGLLGDETVLREAIALLRTHPEAQPNEPLTLEELRGNVGKPVWVQSPGIPEYGSWRIVAGVDTEGGERTLYCSGDYTCRDYGKVWLAYRRPPKED